MQCVMIITEILQSAGSGFCSLVYKTEIEQMSFILETLVNKI